MLSGTVMQAAFLCGIILLKPPPLLTIPKCNPHVIGIRKPFLCYVVLNSSAEQWSLPSFAIFNRPTVSQAKHCMYSTFPRETQVLYLPKLFIIYIAMLF